MQPEDRVVLNAFKLNNKAASSIGEREKAKAQAEKATAVLKGVPIREAFGRIAEYFLARKRMQEIGNPVEAPLSDILSLGRAGLLQSAEYAWAEAGEAVNMTASDDLLKGAPSPRFLESIATKQKDLLSKALALLSERFDVSESSAVLEWAVHRAKGKDLAKLAPLLLCGRPRAQFLQSYENVLKSALYRDKSGELLRACLVIGKNDQQAFDRLRVAILGDNKLLLHFLIGLPKTVSSPEREEAVRLLGRWRHFL